MKKSYIISLIFLTACLGAAFNTFKTSGMHPSSTGAPGEGNCSNATTGCHTGAPITNDNTGIVNTLTYSTPDSSYLPGQTYTITVKAQKSGISKFGFGIVALRVSNNSNQGTWVVTDAARTHTVTGTGTLSTRKYMTHNTASTPALSPGLNQWTFAWTAPSTNVGNITFYYATNCTNNNAAATGDQLYLSNFTIHPFTGTSVDEWIHESELLAALDGSSNELLLEYSLKKECEVAFSIYDLQGRALLKTEPQYRFTGKNNEKIALSEAIGSGIYLVNLHIGDQVLTKKIMIQ